VFYLLFLLGVETREAESRERWNGGSENLFHHWSRTARARSYSSV